jgi:hypothetical protein
MKIQSSLDFPETRFVGLNVIVTILLRTLRMMGTKQTLTKSESPFGLKP